MAWDKWDKKTKDQWHYNGPAATVDHLIQQRDEARAAARLAVTTWHWHQEAGHPPGMGDDEPTIQQLYKEHPWLKDPPDSEGQQE